MLGGARLAELQALPIETRRSILGAFTDFELECLLFDWRGFMARPEQLMPAGLDWFIWYLDMGRGAGKTRSAAEGVREWVRQGKTDIALIGADSKDARDVMIEGRSGMKAVCWNRDRTVSGQYLGVPSYNPSLKRLTWANGAQAFLYSGEDPEELRGPEHACGWVDELGKYQYPQELWDQFMFGLRAGPRPQVIVSTTPRPLKLLRDMKKRPDARRAYASTFDNAANLPESFIAELHDKYDGTRIGRQELYAEHLEDVPGALWQQSWLDRDRIKPDALPELKRVAVAVDPPGSATEGSDEAGIVAGGVCRRGHGYLIADASGVMSPRQWGRKAIRLAERVQADCIVAEKNFGGDMVKDVIESCLREDGSPERFRVKLIHSSRGKVIRADPVSAIYEQGKVHHVGEHKRLEEQMCEFTYDWDRNRDGSPDRLDANVHLWNELFGLVLNGELTQERASVAETVRSLR